MTHLVLGLLCVLAATGCAAESDEPERSNPEAPAGGTSFYNAPAAVPATADSSGEVEELADRVDELEDQRDADARQARADELQRDRDELADELAESAKCHRENLGSDAFYDC